MAERRPGRAPVEAGHSLGQALTATQDPAEHTAAARPTTEPIGWS